MWEAHSHPVLAERVVAFDFVHWQQGNFLHVLVRGLGIKAKQKQEKHQIKEDTKNWTHTSPPLDNLMKWWQNPLLLVVVGDLDFTVLHFLLRVQWTNIGAKTINTARHGTEWIDCSSCKYSMHGRLFYFSFVHFVHYDTAAPRKREREKKNQEEDWTCMDR